MSAYMVTDKHILFLVCAWTRYRRDLNVTVLGEDMALAAEMLKRANHASVIARYGATEAGDMWPVEAFHFDPNAMPFPPREIDPVHVIKAAQCLDYQSCEVDGWEETRAAQWIDGLIRTAITKIPGYDAAPWSIT